MQYGIFVSVTYLLDTLVRSRSDRSEGWYESSRSRLNDATSTTMGKFYAVSETQECSFKIIRRNASWQQK